MSPSSPMTRAVHAALLAALAPGISILLVGCGAGVIIQHETPGCQLSIADDFTGGARILCEPKEVDDQKKGKWCAKCPQIYVPTGINYLEPTDKKPNKFQACTQKGTCINQANQCPGSVDEAGTEADDDWRTVRWTIPKETNEKGEEIESATPVKMKYKKLSMRAIRYVPRPVGKVGHIDLYGDKFYYIHNRDLYIIAKILKANTIRLDPWVNDEDHSLFFQLARFYGLFVIPTFDLSYFFTTEIWQTETISKITQTVVKRFDEFLKHVRKKEPVLMWSINYGLFLNETVTQGEKSPDSDQVKRYFALVNALRQIHYKNEWDDDKMIYLRPLALPLMLDSAATSTDVAWFTALTEGKWSVMQQREFDKSGARIKNDNAQAQVDAGGFDVWIAQMTPPTQAKQMKNVMDNLVLFNYTESDDDEGGLYPDCPADEDCRPPPSRKAIVLQIGFSALNARLDRLLKYDVDVTHQQQYLRKVWNFLINKKFVDDVPNRFKEENVMELNTRLRGEAFIEGETALSQMTGTCVIGGIIDEWNDDWDRCATMGYPTMAYVQNKGGVCDELEVGKLIHVEWFGLNAQYSFFGRHCIDPRFHKNHSSLDDKEGGHGEDFGFRFEWPGFNSQKFDKANQELQEQFVTEENEAWKGVKLCQMVMPDTSKIVELAVCVVLLIGIWMVNCFKTKKRNALEKAADDLGTAAEDDDAADSAKTSKNVAADLLNSKRIAKTALLTDQVNAGKARGQMKVFIPHLLGDTPKDHDHFILEIESNKIQSGALRKMTDEQVVSHLKAHCRTQERRLYHQLECEALAVQVLEEEKDFNKCLPLAMTFTYARVMEGYLSWMENRIGKKDPAITQEMLDRLLAEGEHGYGKNSRPAWELWTEALLIRIIESLSEQILHSPEFICYFFHKVRFGPADAGEHKHKSVDLSKDGEIHFLLDYSALHRGIEELKFNPNPYKGGVNFEDINDFGVNNLLPDDDKGDIWPKTFKESISLMVCLDIMGNFQPVFTVKLWGVSLAWYLYLGEDARNGVWYELWKPRWRRLQLLQIFTCIDVGFLLFSEIALLLHGYGQGRLTWGRSASRWLMKRVVYIITGLCLTGACYVNIISSGTIESIDFTKRQDEIEEKDYTTAQSTAVYTCFGIYLVHMIVLVILTRSQGETSFLPGTPRARSGGKEGDYTCRLAKAEKTTDSNDPEAGGVGAEKKRRSKNIESQNYLALLSWICMGIMTFCFELISVVPLCSGFDWTEFCGSRCKARNHIGQNDFTMINSMIGSDCIACSGTLGASYVLVGLTGFFDIYFIFYLGTAVCGYIMGESRGLRDALSSTHAYIDLETTSAKKKDKDPARREAQRGRASHGESMRFVFGQSWRMVWVRVVEALYEDCLIKDKDVENMAKAAHSVRWSKRKDPRETDAFAESTEKFTKLRFTSAKPRSSEFVKDLVKETRCISALHVKYNDEEKTTETLKDEKDFKASHLLVELSNAAEAAKLVQALGQEKDKYLFATKDEKIGQVTVEQGFELVSGFAVHGFNEIEVIESLKQLAEAEGAHNWPQTVVFKNPKLKFEVVTVDCQTKPIHSVSWSTGTSKPSFDPIQWKVEGLHETDKDEKGGGLWKQLVWQDAEYLPPYKREEELPCFFVAEFWRKGSEKGKKVVDLSSLASEVNERLGFFVHTLPHLIGSSNSVYSIQEDERLDCCHMGKIPMLSQVTPVYNETVIMMEDNLKQTDGVNTNLAFIISQYPNEWTSFTLKHRHQLAKVLERNQVSADEMPRELYLAFVEGVLSGRATVAERIGGSAGREMQKRARELIMEVRWWASMRSQTVSRTIYGAIQYHEVLQMLECVKEYQVREYGDLNDAVEHCCELVMAHQTYGSKSSPEPVDCDIRYMLELYKQYPFYVVLDYDADKGMKPSLQKKVAKYVHDHFGFDGSVRYASIRGRYKQAEEKVTVGGEEIHYVTLHELRFWPIAWCKKHGDQLFKALGSKSGEPPKNHWELMIWIAQNHKEHIRPHLSKTLPPPVGFAATGKTPDDDFFEIVDLLPRQYPLLVGSAEFKTQGKAGNQLGALRFARGHFMQMMDCNMGAFLGETTKVPFILRRFQPRYINRTQVEARIIGFRESIFTSAHGQVGNIMASAEWSFGTICQRFLKGLGMRMHYGHPDFLDGYWASNRGSLSKASPAINLSEDIFAGFNVSMRGEKSKHVDALSWEKGRESSFNAACLFFTKVSKGNVGVQRSRDLKIICESLNIMDNFSFYFASIGFYLNNVMIDFSVLVYVSLFVLLVMASKTLEEVGTLDSMLATEWVVSLGTVAMVPRFMELTLEYGPLAGIIKFCPSVVPCMMMFTFINKSIASAVKETMLTGEAAYIGTGRPNANTHYSWRECYFIHVLTHYYPALTIWTCYALYKLLASEYTMNSLPMMVTMFFISMWIVAPIIFCPQPTFKTLPKDLSEFWQFCIATPEGSVIPRDVSAGVKSTEKRLRCSLGDARSTLYEFWLKQALEHKKQSVPLRIVLMFWDILQFMFVMAVCYSSMLDHIWNVVVLCTIHILMMEFWRTFNRPTVIIVIDMLMWPIAPGLIWPDTSYVNLMVIIIVLLIGLKVVQDVILLCSWGYYRPQMGWEEMTEKTDGEKRRKIVAAMTVIKYDAMVEWLFVNFLGHLMHLYAALVVLIIDLIVQSFCMLIDSFWGMHSILVLNPNLSKPGCCAKTSGYVPGSNPEPGARSHFGAVVSAVRTSITAGRPAEAFQQVASLARPSLSRRGSGGAAGAPLVGAAGGASVEMQAPAKPA